MTLTTRNGRLRPAVRKAIRDATKVHRHSRMRVEVRETDSSDGQWHRLEDIRLPRSPSYIDGPLTLALRSWVQVGMFHMGRMVPGAVHGTMTVERSGEVTMDPPVAWSQAARNQTRQMGDDDGPTTR